MPALADSNVLAALVGAAAALAFTAGRDALLASRRRRATASAIVWELRLRERKLRADLTAASEHMIIVFDPPPSEAVWTTFLNDLPDLGGRVFGAVHGAYAQFRQIAYIKARLQPRFEEPSISPSDNLVETYLGSTRQGITRTEEALAALRTVAPTKAFTVTLPDLTQLTDIEGLFYRRTRNPVTGL